MDDSKRRGDPRRASRGGVTEQGHDALIGASSADMQRIDVNRASAAELASVEGLGDGLAEAIVEDRMQHGPYRSFDELRRIPGLTDGMVVALEHATRIAGPG